MGKHHRHLQLNARTCLPVGRDILYGSLDSCTGPWRSLPSGLRISGSHVLHRPDKRGHEIDFVIVPTARPPVAIECKWFTEDFDERGVQAFRRRYPRGPNFVIAHDVDRPFKRSYKNVIVDFISQETLIDMVSHM